MRSSYTLKTGCFSENPTCEMLSRLRICSRDDSINTTYPLGALTLINIPDKEYFILFYVINHKTFPLGNICQNLLAAQIELPCLGVI